MDNIVRLAESWCVTDYDTFTSSFQWTIKKFRQRCAKDERTLESPIFSSSPGRDRYKWKLKMNPSFHSYVSLHLTLVSKPDDHARAGVEMAIYANGKPKYKRESESAKLSETADHATLVRRTVKVGTKSIDLGFIDFIKREELFTDGFLVDNSLTVFCKVTVFLFDNVTHTTGSRYSIAVPECDVSTHFGSLLSSEEFSDVTLVVGSEELKAHRLVLSARSPVFKTMFQVDMRENLTNRVEITDIELPVVQEMLTFIYTGNSPNLNLKNMASKLLFAADKYQLDRLKLMCEEALSCKLNLGNVSQMLELAEMHSATQLKAVCRDFFFHSYSVAASNKHPREKCERMH